MKRLGEFEDQSRLAEAGIADDVDGTEAAGLHHIPMLAQKCELDVAAAQARQAVAALGAETRDAGAERIEPVDLDRLRFPLETPLAEKSRVDETFNQIECRLADADRAGRRRSLKARGHVHRIAERAIGHGPAFADLADDGGPGVDADAQLRPHPVARLELAVQAPHALLDVEGGAAGPERRVLHGNRRPEHGHDAVAGKVLHHAAVGLDRFALLANDAPGELEHGFFAETLAHHGEVHHVGEHHGQMAPLALHAERSA